VVKVMTYLLNTAPAQRLYAGLICFIQKSYRV
jgi:hypothetical protein